MLLSAAQTPAYTVKSFESLGEERKRQREENMRRNSTDEVREA